MNFKEMTKMFLMNEDVSGFKNSLDKLKENGIYGKATNKGISINYNGKKFLLPTDCSEIPEELARFSKDIKNVFKGKTHGGVDRIQNGSDHYTAPDPYKVGHRAQFLLKK